MKSTKKNLVFWLEKFQNGEEFVKESLRVNPILDMFCKDEYIYDKLDSLRRVSYPFLGFGVLHQRATQIRSGGRRLFSSSGSLPRSFVLPSVGSQSSVQITDSTVWTIGSAGCLANIGFNRYWPTTSSSPQYVLTSLKAWSEDGGFMKAGKIIVKRLLTHEEIEDLRWDEDPRFFAV